MYKRQVKALELVKIEAMFSPLIILLVGLSTVLTVYVGGVQVIEGNLELGHIFQFVFYVNLLTWPFASVGWVTSLVQKAEASMQRILNFLESEPGITSPETLSGELDRTKGIEFENVSYTYPETGIEAISGLSFELKPGETVAITGRTGSGKSTVAQLCMRLMDPSAGSIKFKGVDLKDQPLSEFKSKTGYVPQDVFLFSDTIENNISFGTSDSSHLDDKGIENSAKLSAVHNDIIGLESGYKTILGERGVNLSGGQKQRISIARALLRKPDILILDDCLSAVDTSTEKHIIDSLTSLRDSNPNTAILMVSHRISTINHAHNIIVIDEGRVVESGTHEELVNSGGLYSEMNTQQLTEKG